MFGCFTTMSSVPPISRRYHFSAGRNRSVFYWGGETWDEANKKFVPPADLEYLYELDIVADKWKKHLLKGQHPPGVYWGACAVVGDCLYLYGGENKQDKLTGSLFELNLSTKSWRELSCPGTGGPKKTLSCDMVAYNSTLIVYRSEAVDGVTNELHMFDLKAGTWSSVHVTGDVPPPYWSFTFTKVSNHQVVLRGEVRNKDTYVLDLSRMHWKKLHHSGPEQMAGPHLVAACLGLGSDHAQLLQLRPHGHAQVLDVATWKWMKIKLVPDDVVISPGCSATAIQTSPTSVEVVVYGDELVRLKFRKRPSAPEGVSPVQWWILTDYTPDRKTRRTKKHKLEVGGVMATGLSKPADAQTSSITRDDDFEDGQAVSVNVSTFNSEMQSETTSKETDEVSTQAENIDATVSEAHEPGFVRDVIEAVDKNQQIQRRMANVILKGLPEAGKSTLLNRLLKRPFKKSYSSTGLSDDIVVVDIQPTSTLTSATATSDNSSWEVIDFDASMYSQLEDLKQFLPSAGELPIKGSSSNNTLSYQVHRISNSSEVPDNIKKVLRAHNIKSIEDLKMKNSLYIRDTGGQVEFQESLTLLIYGPSIFIFVLRTDIDIYKKTIIRYREPSGKIINRYQSSISTVDALVQFLTSVSAIEITKESVFQKGGDFPSHEPVVFIVGTHIDLLESRADSVVAEINESLDIIIREHGFTNVVRYCDADCKKVIYTVNNTREDEQNIGILRSHVNSYIGNRLEFEIKYPVGYLLFCLELQNIKAAVISIASFTQLASKFSIASISHLLHFLHFRIGIIQHYDVENLSDIVIKEPQVLFSKVTDLLVKTFLSSEALKMDEQASFCQKGILEASVLENILGKKVNEITSKQFLAFMVHLRLAVPFIDKNGIRKYFIPSVLNHVPRSSGEERKTDIAPLAICFRLGHCPQGIFGALISHLVSPDESHDFIFDLSEDQIYQDQITLLVITSEDVDEISLKRHLSHIEINLFLEASSSDTKSQPFLASRSITPSALCTKLRSILQDCLKCSLETLHYDWKKLQPMFCLRCPTAGCTSMHKVITQENSFMYCNVFKAKCAISSGHQWFSESYSQYYDATESKDKYSTLSTKTICVKQKSNSSCATGSSSDTTLAKPDFSLQKLTLLKWTDDSGQIQRLRLRDELCSKWHDVGILLGVSSGRLKSIFTYHLGDLRLCCSDILLEWLQKAEMTYSASWDGLLDLLEDLELMDVSAKLRLAMKL